MNTTVFLFLQVVPEAESKDVRGNFGGEHRWSVLPVKNSFHAYKVTCLKACVCQAS